MKFKFTNQALRALKPRVNYYQIYDTDLKGFCARVQPSGKINFFVRVRSFNNTNRPKEFTIGEYANPLTLMVARERASDALIKLSAGIDPGATRSENDIPLSEFAPLYSSETDHRKKPRSIEAEQSLLKRHILPRMGKLYVGKISKADISSFMRSVANQKKPIIEPTKSRGKAVVTGGVATANRARDVLSSMMTHAIDIGLRSDNPVSLVKPFKKTKRERYLSGEEFSRLGQALKACKDGGENIFAIRAIQLLLLTGARKTEILSLKWGYIDRENRIAKLPDSKTGAKPLYLPDAAIEMIDALPRLEGSEWVFPSLKTEGHLIGLQKVWERIRTKAGLEDVRIHDLRHSFASVGAMSGQSLFIVGKILGHSNSATTQRYAHLSANPIHSAVSDISSEIIDKLGEL